jgi:hypothetical protein
VIRAGGEEAAEKVGRCFLPGLAPGDLAGVSPGLKTAAADHLRRWYLQKQENAKRNKKAMQARKGKPKTHPQKTRVGHPLRFFGPAENTARLAEK